MTRWLMVLLAMTLLTSATPVSGQSREERSGLARLRDSLAGVHLPFPLLAEEERLIELARADRDNPMLHLRLGLVALRLAELVPGTRHVEHAAQEFEWAAELRPYWPWPWYGIGLASARGRNSAGGFAGGLYSMLGLDRDRTVADAFARAILADPFFAPPLLEYADIALEQRIDPPGAAALAALRTATRYPLGWDPDLLLALGRLERRFGDPDSARTAFRRSALLGMSPGAAWLELARTPASAAFEPGDEGNAARRETQHTYRRAITTGNLITIAAIRRDLEPLARQSELEAFDRISLRSREALADWLHQFWSRRDAIDVRESGSRLVEHYRRWQVAEREFRLPPFRRRYRWGIENYRSGDPEFDDRGIVYIRHGEPALRIVWPRASSTGRISLMDRNYGNETWRYDRSDGRFELHFVARDDQDDYRLVDSPTELDVDGDILVSRAHEIPGMQRLVRAGPASLEMVREEVRADNRIAMAIATQTDSWARVYSRVLEGAVQWMPVGNRGGVPIVHLLYGVDGDALRRVAGDSSAVRLRVRASAISARGEVVATLDTVQIVPVPQMAGTVVASRAEMLVPSGRVRVRFAVEADEATGVVFPSDSLMVPFPQGRALDISAVMLGTRNRSLSWQKDADETVWMDLAPRYGTGDTVSVYAEIYGAGAGETVAVELTVKRRRSGLARLFGSETTAIGLTEELTVPAGRVIEYDRELALMGLAAGDYLLELRVGTGERAEIRRRGISVVSRPLR